MNPLLHLALQMSRTPVDSPGADRRREILREHNRVARARQAQRRRKRVRQAVVFLAARRWRCDQELAGKAG